MYNTIRNVALALSIGSIVAIVINMKAGPDYKNASTGSKAARQEFVSAGSGIMPVFNRTALALGFFVFSALFIVKPIKQKNNHLYKAD